MASFRIDPWPVMLAVGILAVWGFSSYESRNVATQVDQRLKEQQIALASVEDRLKIGDLSVVIFKVTTAIGRLLPDILFIIDPADFPVAFPHHPSLDYLGFRPFKTYTENVYQKTLMGSKLCENASENFNTAFTWNVYQPNGPDTRPPTDI